jgi:hypothetical protein
MVEGVRRKRREMRRGEKEERVGSSRRVYHTSGRGI